MDSSIIIGLIVIAVIIFLKVMKLVGKVVFYVVLAAGAIFVLKGYFGIDVVEVVKSMTAGF